MSPQSTFSLALLAALVEDVVVDGRPLSRMVPAKVPTEGSTSEWDLIHLGDTLLKLAEAQCVARPGMFRTDGVAAPPPASTLATAVRLAEEWAGPALRLFPSGSDGTLGWAVNAAITYLITTIREPMVKSAFTYAVVQAMLDTVTQHRDYEKPGHNR